MRSMEWLETLQKLIPIYGPVVPPLAFLYLMERYEHRKTREELKRSYEARVSEAMTMTKVVEGSTAASNARDGSQGELVRSLQSFATTLQGLSATITQALIGAIRR